MRKLLSRPSESAMFATTNINEGDEIIGLVGLKADRGLGRGYKYCELKANMRRSSTAASVTQYTQILNDFRTGRISVSTIAILTEKCRADRVKLRHCDREDWQSIQQIWHVLKLYPCLSIGLLCTTTQSIPWTTGL
jgi:hypothetical protein